ncbi:hypothetical protein ABK040_003363 [Willaertia magna]
MSLLTAGIQAQNIDLDSLRNITGQIGFGVLDLSSGRVLNKEGEFYNQPHLLDQIYFLLQDVKGLIKEQSLQKVNIKLDDLNYLISISKTHIFVVLTKE